MAALDVITRLLKPGDEVIAGDDLYGGTNRLLTYLKTHGGVVVHHVNTTNPLSVLPHLRPSKTAMVLLESPTNPLLKICDIARISKDVKERCPDALVVVDNTMMSPYLQRPLEHGADIVYDSATKYLSGHHDLMAGVICVNRDDLAKVCLNTPLSGAVGTSGRQPFWQTLTFIPLANRVHYQLGWKRTDPVRLVPTPSRHQDPRNPHGPTAIDRSGRGHYASERGLSGV
jgi:cystathionine beta-lyase/cystathionine gamma-synthase